MVSILSLARCWFLLAVVVVVDVDVDFEFLVGGTADGRKVGCSVGWE